MKKPRPYDLSRVLEALFASEQPQYMPDEDHVFQGFRTLREAVAAGVYQPRNTQAPKPDQLCARCKSPTGGTAAFSTDWEGPRCIACTIDHLA